MLSCFASASNRAYEILPLTSNIVTIPPPLKRLLRMLLIPPRYLAHELIPRGEQYYRKQGEDKRANAINVPATEDDAQVGRVPCEEHLSCLLTMHWSFLGGGAQRELGDRRVAYIHVARWSVVHAAVVAVVHVAVIHL